MVNAFAAAVVTVSYPRHQTGCVQAPMEIRLLRRKMMSFPTICVACIASGVAPYRAASRTTCVAR